MMRTNMNSLLPLLVVALVPVAAGCTLGRTAPFDSVKDVTVMRLQGQEAPQNSAGPFGALLVIPGIPPELQQMGQQAMQGLQQMLPPGLIPPGLIPGGGPMSQTPQNAPRFKNFVILGQMPLTDEETKEELLDLFGSEGSFAAEKGQCFTPGMGITMSRPNEPPVDLLISIQCNQAMGDGFKWPYPVNGFTPETKQKLTKIHEKLWGPVPPGA
jgi:hypothetical protein